MDVRNGLGLLALLVTVVLLVGAVVNLAVENALFLGSEWATPALATVGLVAIFVAALVAIGGPDWNRPRTPYW